MNKIIITLFSIFFSFNLFAASTITASGGITILLFITVLQKEKEVYECQEYQTLDNEMKTLDMSLVCKELFQPYRKGMGI